MSIWNTTPPGVPSYMPYSWGPAPVVRMNPMFKGPRQIAKETTYTPVVKFGWKHYIVGPDQLTHDKAKKIAKREAEKFRAHMQAAAEVWLANKGWEEDKE